MEVQTAAIAPAPGVAHDGDPARRRRPWRPVRIRGGGGIPATRDLEAALFGLVGLSACELAVAALVPSRPAAVAAYGAAIVTVAAAAAVLCAVLHLLPSAMRSGLGVSRRPVRAAVVGSVASALDLRTELQCAKVSGVDVAGVILAGPLPAQSARDLELGALEDVGRIVEEHGIDVLLVGFGVSRVTVVDAILQSCEGHAVRLCDLSSFYEDVFGRVPITGIDNAWFELVLHPRFRDRRSQRVFDVAVAVTLVAMFLPLLVAVGLIIRRDGKPALYRQLRIGQHGRPFWIYKLRTMRWEDEPTQRWSSTDDPRVTRLGRLLRRTHLDELPQLLNVLRGEMTLVGPRPEQPEIAARLQETLPLWRGRYWHKPGMTGWAQIRCGYAASDDSSAWKLAHDLYYLRRRSFSLDVAILAQTASTVLFTPQYAEAPATPFVVRRPERPVDRPLQPLLASDPRPRQCA